MEIPLLGLIQRWCPKYSPTTCGPLKMGVTGTFQRTIRRTHLIDIFLIGIVGYSIQHLAPFGQGVPIRSVFWVVSHSVLGYDFFSPEVSWIMSFQCHQGFLQIFLSCWCMFQSLVECADELKYFRIICTKPDFFSFVYVKIISWNFHFSISAGTCFTVGFMSLENFRFIGTKNGFFSLNMFWGDAVIS